MPAKELIFRRFFDVNHLAAIRVELPKVFETVHRLVLELVSTGAVTGLRIDHPDGLYLPDEYFEKLQQRCAKMLRSALPRDGRAIYVVAEKILTGPETLRTDWRGAWNTRGEFSAHSTQILGHSPPRNPLPNTFTPFI